METAEEVMKHLETTFGKQDHFACQSISSALIASMMIDGTTILDHMMKLNNHFQDLEAVVKNVSELTNMLVEAESTLRKSKVIALVTEKSSQSSKNKKKKRTKKGKKGSTNMWCMDSRSTAHICNMLQRFQENRKNEITLKVGTGDEVDVVVVGTYFIRFSNDILLIGNDVGMLSSVKIWLSTNFSMKDLGDATYVVADDAYLAGLEIQTSEYDDIGAEDLEAMTEEHGNGCPCRDCAYDPFQVQAAGKAATDDYDYGGDDAGADTPPAPPPAQDNCAGIFLSYTFMSREKEYPHTKNATAQAWAFKSMATILNAGDVELQNWQIYIGFQHKEILVSASNAVILDGDDFPASVGNGTSLVGYPQTDLKTSIETANDFTQIQTQIEMTGTQFGVKPPGIPMPKTIKLDMDAYKCPAPTKANKGYTMYVCCHKNPKFKAKKPKSVKFLPRQEGDLSISYDITQANAGNYLAQVTLENTHPLGRLDHWNLTWEWMRGEFIFSMKGAYTHLKDPSDCLYGPAGQYYQDFDFSTVLNCERKPIISDLPPDRAKDDKIGNVPFCCRNGTLLPTTMDETKTKAAFQMQVFKIPPDMNRTAIFPPQRWKINGVLNPDYKCGAPIRVDPTETPDPTGLATTTEAIASWQIVCNITKPKTSSSHCCVSFSAFYNDSVIPCNTCACGCSDTETCNPNAKAMLLPPEALLVPFDNRTAKAKAWAKLKHYKVPNPLPCADNCGVSINWHISSDYRKGWTARITLFNWEEINFEDWFTAIQMNKAYAGYENVYSFNGTRVPELEKTIFFQGLPGLTYLMGETNGTDPKRGPRVPGKQQSVISFSKKKTPGINIVKGDGFPTKVYFNGEECSLPTVFPKSDGHRSSHFSLLPLIFLTIMTFVFMTDHHLQ
ncbi:COBRA-like protein 10 [Telopea speciosissima]|uniref:COBRA-like protein 10 n=1 Tax=Telopea speciosissima TaxID=54955 RepID=UPI001CC5E6EC|nr:COBRA-like protein 10 [Telopea speciosissima]